MSKLFIRTRYATIPNSILRNKGISFKAKGLWSYIQSKPDGWEFSVDRIQSETNDGEKSIRSGIKELEDAGLLVRIQARAEEGKFSGHDYELLEIPSLELRKRFAEKPSAENRQTAPEVENPPSILSKKDILKENVIEFGNGATISFEGMSDKEVRSFMKGDTFQAAKDEIRRRKDNKYHPGKPFNDYTKKAPKVVNTPLSPTLRLEDVTPEVLSEVAKETGVSEDDVETAFGQMSARIRSGEMKSWNNTKEQLMSWLLGGIKRGYVFKEKSLEESIIEEYGCIWVGDKKATTIEEYRRLEAENE